MSCESNVGPSSKQGGGQTVSGSGKGQNGKTQTSTSNNPTQTTANGGKGTSSVGQSQTSTKKGSGTTTSGPSGSSPSKPDDEGSTDGYTVAGPRSGAKDRVAKLAIIKKLKKIAAIQKAKEIERGVDQKNCGSKKIKGLTDQEIKLMEAKAKGDSGGSLRERLQRDMDSKLNPSQIAALMGKFKNDKEWSSQEQRVIYTVPKL